VRPIALEIVQSLVFLCEFQNQISNIQCVACSTSSLSRIGQNSTRSSIFAITSLLPVGAGEYRELELPSGWSL
jgi:hypothetical protein